MRNFVLALVAVSAGCATVQDSAAVKRRAESVVWGAMGSRSPVERERATRIAADVADPVLDRGLAARLGDPLPSVRAIAASALAPETPPARDILRAILDGNDAAAKVIAIDAIGTLPDAKQRLTALAADPDLRVRARAATAIAQWKPPEARALLDTLVQDDDPGVRGQALAGLAQLGDPGALDEITAALGDPTLQVRLAALGALVRLGRDSIEQKLLALADDGRHDASERPGNAGPDHYVALRAAVQLSRDGRAVAALPSVRLAAESRDAALRVAAMNAAGELGPVGHSLALAHLRDPDLDVRLAAARAVVVTGRRALAIPTLVAALSTPRRLDAAETLAEIEDPRGLAVLRDAAQAKDVGVRRHALALLAPLPDGRDALIAALRDDDPELRLQAAGALLRRIYRNVPR